MVVDPGVRGPVAVAERLVSDDSIGLERGVPPTPAGGLCGLDSRE